MRPSDGASEPVNLLSVYENTLFSPARQFPDRSEWLHQPVLKQDSTNREARLTLALIYLEKGERDKGIEKLALLLQESPTDYRLAYLLGSTYEEAGFFDKALLILREIPVTAEQFTSAQLRMGMILKKQLRVNEAIDSLRKAIQKKRNAPELYGYIAALYEEDKRYPEAEEILREGLGTLPGSVELHYGMGVLYEKSGRFEESIAAMKEVLKLDPDHADALNFIGYMYADKGIYLDEAEKMIKRALELKPGNSYMTDSLGWLYFRRGRLDEAIRYLREASEALPEDPAILDHLGDAYTRSGKIQEAVDAYRRAIQFNPDSEPLKRKLNDLLEEKRP